MFYDKYKELCAKKGVSPFAAARDLGISSRTQGNWKKGSSPRIGTLLKIADYFRVDVSYFDEDDDDGIDNTIEDTPIVRSFIEEMRQKNVLTEDENLMLMMFRSVTDEQRQELIKAAMKMVLKDETR